jgi:hypothetical protein
MMSSLLIPTLLLKVTSLLPVLYHRLSCASYRMLPPSKKLFLKILYYPLDVWLAF